MKCIVIDDEPMALEILEDYISKIPFLELAGVFRNSLKALSFIQKQDIDLLFLDINMPDLTGIQFLKSLTRPPHVIFTTAYSEYAVESYEYQAVDYLLKPIEFDRFLKAANRAYEQFQLLQPEEKKISIDTRNKKSEFILIKSGMQFYKISIADISYIESAANYVFFHLKEKKKIMALLSLKKVMEMLPAGQFIRIHKSFIIHLKYIEKVESPLVWIAGEKLPIGKIYRESFIKQLNI